MCDVRKVDETIDEKSVDLTLWSHGPEHVYREDWDGALRRLETVTRKVIILQCPWGSAYDNDPEHLSKSVVPEEFQAFGYETDTCGVKDNSINNLLSWKILND